MTEEIDPELHSLFINHGDINIHLVHNGHQKPDGSLDTGSRQILLLLHGFPEYHGAWADVLPLLAEDFLIIAPDQRGFNLSSAPQDVADYQTRLLVDDMIQMMDTLVPDTSYHLVGHDWGASIAYALAMRNPERVSTLNIINGVHPITFQRALSTNKAQGNASQYFHVLCARDAATRLSGNGFEKLLAMFEYFSPALWLDEARKQKYLDAWSKPGRLNAMLSWYRASPVAVPVGEEPVTHAPLLDADPAKFRIEMPHLVIWGMKDTALLPVAREGLEEFADNLEIVEVGDADHWINHTHPELIAREIRRFISEN